MSVVVVALLAALGCSPEAPPAPPAPAPEARAPDPLRDPLDDTPMDVPATELGHVAPRPPGASAPRGQPAPVPAVLPNVVLVVGCTVRKDQMSAYGAPVDTTPFLASLAASGTRFDDAIAAAPWTRAAATAILTGHHAARIGMADAGNGRDDSKLPASTVTLAERFRGLGYLTIGATANPNLSPDFGFDQGFESYQLGLEGKFRDKILGPEIADAAVAEVGRRRAAGDARPVYLRLVLIDAHEPRGAPPSAYAPFVTPEVPARVARYRAHLRRLDDALARLDTGLASVGLTPENTVFVFVADHGEGMDFPWHHGHKHGQYFGSSAIYVPWILRGPGVSRGHVITGPASQTDVVPTLLGLVGRPVADDEPLDGLDLSALVRGEGQQIDRPWVLSDTWFAGASRAAIVSATHLCQADFGSATRTQRKGRFVAGCYDRIADPLATRPGDDPGLLEALHAWRTETARILEATKVETATVDPELAAGLRALGYVDGPDPEGRAP